MEFSVSVHVGFTGCRVKHVKLLNQVAGENGKNKTKKQQK